MDRTKFNKTKTNRGFGLIEFKDYYNKKCSIQKSSIATQPMIWMGIDDPEPQIMASELQPGGVGWVPFYIPSSVVLSTRMHLTKPQAWGIVKILIRFLITSKV